MRIDYKKLAFFCVATMFQSVTLAAPGPNAPALGVMRGRVVDTNNQVLPGASVIIESLHTGVVSDVNGYYTLSNLQPGTYTVKVTYVGYEPKVMKLTVSSDKTAEQNFVLTDGVELKGIEVKGAFHGQSKAINQQKNNFNLTNVVSADQVGKFPDSNIGDALKRINGINVQYDQGEARFGQVRGTSPDLSSVSVNGNRLPSAESDARNVQLDLIPADMIQSIEVNKVVTSDMDGDAIGGAINLVTKNTPYREVFNVTAGTGYSWISEKMQLNLGATYGNRFFNNKFGIMAALSYQNSPAGSDNCEYTYDLDDKGNVVLTDADIRQYYVTRERQSYSLSMDYDFNTNNKIYFNGIYNRRNDWENRYALSFKGLADGAGQMSVKSQLKMGSADDRNARRELQQTMDFTLGGKHLLWDRLHTDWSASFSRASENKPDQRYFTLKQKGLTIDMADEGGRHPYALTPVSLAVGDWKVDELSNANEDVDENEWKAKVDFELPLTGGLFGNSLKFGAKYTNKHKTLDASKYDYTDGYADNYGDEWKQNLTMQIRDGFMVGDVFKPTEFVDKRYIGAFTQQQLDAMGGVRDLEESSGNYDAREQVTAAYLRFTQKLGRNLTMMAGLRMENTNLHTSGWNYTIDENGDGSLEPTGVKKSSYTNWLPSVLFKWDVNDDFKVRASYTKTLARPKYSWLVAGTTYDTGENPVEIALGNPDLKPIISNNYDLSTEYYFKSVGLVSAALFYKRVDNYIVNLTRTMAYGNYSDARVSQPLNAFDADLLGVELGYQRDFGFIAPALRCVGFYGNYTYTHSSIVRSAFGDKGEQALPGSPEHMANASLYFDKWGLNVRLSYNYTSAFQDDEEYQEEKALRRYYDATNYLDLNASYTWGKHTKYTFYVAANNLLNQPLRYYQGEKDRTMQVEYYGVKVNAGFKINF